MEPIELHQLAARAREWAAEAGAIALRLRDGATARRKADSSPVTDADLAVENFLVEAIHRQFPDHSILAEEGGAVVSIGAAGRCCWVIDPIDGTRNYVRGFPCFATSIALLDDGVPVIGVVREHHTNWTFAAAKDGGATLDGNPIHVAQRPLDRDFFVGVPSVKTDESPDAIHRFLTRVNVRNIGSTAMHLALVASGAIDAAYARRCHTWDIAAGCLLVTEAGGVCTDPEGRPLLPLRSHDITAMTPCLAAGPHAHADLLRLLQADPPADAEPI